MKMLISWLERCDKVKDIYILGVETSCDETSMSIVKNGIDEIATVVLTQMDTHANYGGVVPEIASRMHIENITMVLEELLNKSNMDINDITGVAVTEGPGLVGSLLIGIETAKTISYVLDKPLIPVHHIAGHIYANNLVEPLKFPLIALVVSGGHTELIHMKKDYSFDKIGGTLDDAIGEAYDKVARVINLPYPGGPRVDKLAHIGEDTYNLPLPLNDKSYNFSFSGMKSAVINLFHNETQRGNEINKENLSCSFQNRCTEILTKKTLKALENYNVENLVVAGGVAANKGLRTRLEELSIEKNINLKIPPMKYCTDNAAMIAAAGYYAYKLGRRADLDLNAKATLKLN
jgi:putative glycoprotease GCP